MDDFFKFPSTPHLAVLGDTDVRNDKVMAAAERETFLQHQLTVEEKVDGANLGLSFDADGNLRVQNRGAYLAVPGAGQWKKLNHWLSSRVNLLFEHLSDHYLMFGEWCYAQHSVAYSRLPDWFLGFDVYDKFAGSFLSATRRNALLDAAQINKVPTLASGRFTLPSLKKLLAQSALGEQSSEGLYLRVDNGDWLAHRAKLVRPSFIQTAAPHWSHSAIKPNHLRLVARK